MLPLEHPPAHGPRMAGRVAGESTQSTVDQSHDREETGSGAWERDGVVRCGVVRCGVVLCGVRGWAWGAGRRSNSDGEA